MSQAGFLYHNVRFKRYGSQAWVIARGDITNCALKDYHSAMFRISVFSKDVLLWNGTIKIRNFKKRQTRSFELTMTGMDHKLLPTVSKYDIYFDSGY